jgi:drug/metabolite transporter (DMT)-like permease
MPRSLAITAAFAAIYVLWGSTYFAIAIGLESFPPLMLMALRSLCGGILLLALDVRGLRALGAGDWRLSGLCGVLFFVGCHGVLAMAQAKVASGVAAIMLATIPFWTTLIDYVFPERRRPSLFILAVLVPGFAGVGAIGWLNSASAGMPPLLCLLAAALSWSVATVIARRTGHGGSSLARAGLQLTFGGLVLLGLGLATGEAAGNVSPWSLAAVVWLVLAGSVIGFAAYHWLLGNVSTSLVATYTFVNPVIAVLLGAMFLGERLTPLMLVGGGLILASVLGVWIIERRLQRRDSEEQRRLHPHQHHAEDQEGGAQKPHRARRLHGDSEQAEMVEGERGQHLAGDEQGEEGRSAQPRDQQDGEGDEDRAEQAAAPAPPGDARLDAGRGNWVTQCERQHRHADDADEIADESRPRRRPERRAQIGVQRLLHHQADPGRDGEQDRKGELEHGRSLRIGW